MPLKMTDWMRTVTRVKSITLVGIYESGSETASRDNTDSRNEKVNAELEWWRIVGLAGRSFSDGDGLIQICAETDGSSGGKYT